MLNFFEIKIIKKILNGTSDVNIKFSELRKFILSLDFIESTKGDHFIYYKERIIEIMNL